MTTHPEIQVDVALYGVNGSTVPFDMGSRMDDIWKPFGVRIHTFVGEATLSTWPLIYINVNQHIESLSHSAAELLNVAGAATSPKFTIYNVI